MGGGRGGVCLLLLERGVNIRAELRTVLQLMFHWEANGYALGVGALLLCL